MFARWLQWKQMLMFRHQLFQQSIISSLVTQAGYGQYPSTWDYFVTNNNSALDLVSNLAWGWAWPPGAATSHHLRHSLKPQLREQILWNQCSAVRVAVERQTWAREGKQRSQNLRNWQVPFEMCFQQFTTFSYQGSFSKQQSKCLCRGQPYGIYHCSGSEIPPPLWDESREHHFSWSGSHSSTCYSNSRYIPIGVYFILIANHSCSRPIQQREVPPVWRNLGWHLALKTSHLHQSVPGALMVPRWRNAHSSNWQARLSYCSIKFQSIWNVILLISAFLRRDSNADSNFNPCMHGSPASLPWRSDPSGKAPEWWGFQKKLISGNSLTGI